ncbi:translin associated factor X [Corynespora cassiicola Philippines]|uniref:Translin associated factor X n=1 Tax=Corynespora cassiicola Philippines TaxID=1448308 RepID=A0A2T2NYP1_CORCC|nr:translin associated factor X [Corynespora cassiicola Philippines]
MGEGKPEQPSSPYVAMFEGFRKELDEHHDRRERIIKASRDITASSKKMVRQVGQSVPQFVVKNNAQYWEMIEKQYKSISGDVQGLNAFRYERQITGGNQEFMEALSFQHYLETQTLIPYDEAKSRVATMSGEAGAVLLTPEDYILGIFDMVGELMRFSITSMATNGKLPAGRVKKELKSKQEGENGQEGDKMDIDEKAPETQEPRNVLSDLRELRLQLEMFEPPHGAKFTDDVEKKMTVMRECVNKVENALYSLTVRGSERPKGWMPEEGRRGEAVEGF